MRFIKSDKGTGFTCEPSSRMREHEVNRFVNGIEKDLVVHSVEYNVTVQFSVLTVQEKGQ